MDIGAGGVNCAGTVEMKVSKAQKAEHRSLILEAAFDLFREHGFNGVTVAEIMDRAGLSHGGFYGHFQSKDDLIANSLAYAGGQMRRKDDHAFASYVHAYLSKAHRDDRKNACPFSSLGSEVAQASDETRYAMTVSMKVRIAALAETAPGENDAGRRKAAIFGWVATVGAMTLARIAVDDDFSNEILQATREALTA